MKKLIVSLALIAAIAIALAPKPEQQPEPETVDVAAALRELNETLKSLDFGSASRGIIAEAKAEIAAERARYAERERKARAGETD